MQDIMIHSERSLIWLLGRERDRTGHGAVDSEREEQWGREESESREMDASLTYLAHLTHLPPNPAGSGALGLSYHTRPLSARRPP